MTRCTFGWHRWGVWREYEHSFRKVPIMAGMPMLSHATECVEVRQKRRCRCCGIVRDILVRDGPLSATPVDLDFAPELIS